MPENSPVSGGYLLIAETIEHGGKTLRVLLFTPSAVPVWTAQCLEHDVTVQAQTDEEAMAELSLSLDAETDLLESVPPAPLPYHNLWKAARSATN